MKNFTFFMFAGILLSSHVYGQDPALPQANTGQGNMLDGFVPGTGLYYMTCIQVYNTRSLRDANGDVLTRDLKVSSFLSMQQLVWLSPVKALGGNLGATVLLPLVKIAAENSSGPVPAVNPSIRGDLIFGPAIQWLDKRLWNKPIYHRLEFSVSVPVGAYNANYRINPSAHLYTYSLHHTFSYFVHPKWTLTARNFINYNSSILHSAVRPGIFYNGNYAVERQLTKNLRAEIAGYLIQQLEEDSFHGDHRYFQDKYGIASTKESLLGIGPGLSFTSATGLFIEAKFFYEVSAKNRFLGSRPTLRLAFPLVPPKT